MRGAVRGPALRADALQLGPQRGAAPLLRFECAKVGQALAFALRLPVLEFALRGFQVFAPRRYLARKGRLAANVHFPAFALGAGFIGILRDATRVGAFVHLGVHRKPGEQQDNEKDPQSWCCGFTRSTLLAILLSALI